MRLTVTGTPDLSPDCTTPDTGEPAGMYQEQLYWTWTNEAGTWYLRWDNTPERYMIVSQADIVWMDPHWVSTGGDFDLLGTYTPAAGAIGTAIVAEYVPPATTVELFFGAQGKIVGTDVSKVVVGGNVVFG